MATVDVPWDWIVFKIQAYQYIVKVTKFVLPTQYLPFQQSRGKNQPVGGFCALPRPVWG